MFTTVLKIKDCSKFAGFIVVQNERLRIPSIHLETFKKKCPFNCAINTLRANPKPALM